MINTDSPARLHIPRVRYRINWARGTFWTLYIIGALFAARIILHYV